MKLLEKIIIPHDNVNDEVVLIKNIYVENNQKIKKNDLLIDYETSKASIEVYSNLSGYVLLKCSEDEKVRVGNAVVEIWDRIFDNLNDDINPIINKESMAVTFTKKAEKKINDLGLDKALFAKYDIVTETIVEQIIEKNSNEENSNNIDVMQVQLTKLTEIDQLDNSERYGLISIVSKKINTNSLDLDTPYKYLEFKDSIGLLLVKVATEILSKDIYKHLNGYYNNSLIKCYKTVNFGIALNLGDGLKIGVINDVYSKSIQDIEERTLKLIDKYIDGKMQPDDMTGATVILTDLTDQNIDYFMPLVVKNTSIMIGLSGEKGKNQLITIAFDHRVTDGLEVSNFLNEIITEIQKQFKGFMAEYCCSICLTTLEKDQEFNRPGLIKIIDKNEDQKLVCLNCLKGW